VSRAAVDEYLATLEEPKRSTLEQVRRAILAAVPAAEECISYGYPAYRLDGKVVAGFAAFTRHLSYLPHSGSVLPALADELTGYSMSKGALRFPVDAPLPDALVARLVEVRVTQAFPDA
jgi:uncharacterized protein YdhG (YjbR/CyaY superfamily)